MKILVYGAVLIWASIAIHVLVALLSAPDSLLKAIGLVGYVIVIGWFVERYRYHRAQPK